MCCYGKRAAHLGGQLNIRAVSFELPLWRHQIAISVAGAFHRSRKFRILSSNVSLRAKAFLIVTERGCKLQWSELCELQFQECGLSCSRFTSTARDAYVFLVLFVAAHAQAQRKRGRWEYMIMQLIGSKNFRYSPCRSEICSQSAAPGIEPGTSRTRSHGP